MKKCVQCRQPMKKTNPTTYVCSTCGIIKKEIQIGQQQEIIKPTYEKKITQKTEIIKQSTTHTATQLVKMLLQSFQRMLRSAVTQFVTQNPSFETLEVEVRNIWIHYLRLMSNDHLRVTGNFHKLILQNLQARKKFDEAGPGKDDEGDHFEEQLSMKSEQTLNHDEQPFSEPPVEGRKKKGRPKKTKSSTKTQTVRLKIKHFLKSTQTDSPNEQFLNCVFHHQYEATELTSQNIFYLSEKYVQLLTHKYKCKSNIHDLKALCQMRGHFYKKRAQIVLVLLLEDMLKMWASETLPEETENFDELISKYRSGIHVGRKPVIDQIIKQLLGEIKLPHEEHHAKIPGLSFSLVYALINIGVIKSGGTYTLSDIINSCGELRLKFMNKQYDNTDSFDPTKIRILCSDLCGYLNMQQVMPVSVWSWVKKYALQYGLEKHLNSLERLTEVLMGAYRHQHAYGREKFETFQQDVMSKAILLAYFKLCFSFDGYPYLVNTPVKHLLRLSLSPDASNIVKKIASTKEWQTHQFDIIKVYQLILYENKQNSSTKKVQNYPLNKYNEINGYTTAQLLRVFNRKISETKLPSPVPNKTSQLSIPTQIISKKETEAPILNEVIGKQLQVLQETSVLDYPSQNYEYLHHYQTNVNYVNRQLFTKIVKQISFKCCKVSELYEKLQRFQTILKEFEF